MPKLKRKDLLKSQRNGIKKIRKHTHCVLLKDMGLGKTCTALTGFQDLDNRPPILVIAPPSVARNVWHNEVNKWKHLHLVVIPVVGTPEQRKKLIETPADVHVISSGSMKWYASYCNSIKKIPHKWLIVDEAGQYRAPSTHRSQLVEQLARYMKRVVMLTASPAPNGYQDLYQQYKILDGGKRLGVSFEDYKRNYLDENEYSRKITIRSMAHANEIDHLISDVTFRYDVKDYIDMPKLVNNIIPVTLKPTVLRQYKALRKEYYLLLESGEAIDVANALVMAGKLQQWANGTIKLPLTPESVPVRDLTKAGVMLKMLEGIEDDESANGYDYSKLDKKQFQVYDIHQEKLIALVELLENLGERNVLIAYSHRGDLKKILKEIPGSVHFKGQSGLYDKWNNEPNTALRYVAHPASVGHGLNMQDGGNNIVKYGMVRSYEMYEQMIGRLNRQGQSENTVFVHHILTHDTIDFDIFDILQEKGDLQDGLLNRVKIINQGKKSAKKRKKRRKK